MAPQAASGPQPGPAGPGPALAGPSSRWVRSLRGTKRELDPFAPISWFWEVEAVAPVEVVAPVAPAAPGERPEAIAARDAVAVLTVLLAGAECPFTCVFCDLWRETLDGHTPRGALPAQLRAVLAQAGSLPEPCAAKLYNASNFFEQRAVPLEDEPELADLLAPFARVTVECHPRLVGARCLAFAERLRGRLEVAMGLETVHPRALARLNKGMSLDDFDRAAAALCKAGIGLRCFVLVGAPFVPREAAVDWAVRSAAHALERGATRVALIPVRDGNGALERLRRRGDFVPPRLADLEEALDRCLDLGTGLVAADLWEAARFATCPACAAVRIERLARMNRTGAREPRQRCDQCDGR